MALNFLLPPLPQIERQVRQLSPLALAYLGDAVYELYMRSQYLFPPQRVQAYHRQVVDQVNADRQAEYVQSLLPHLTAEELDPPPPPL